MTFKWPFKDPKVWNLTLKPINYPILLIQLICQLQNTHFSDILTTSLKKSQSSTNSRFHTERGSQPSVDDQSRANRSRSTLMSRWGLNADPTVWLIDIFLVRNKFIKIFHQMNSIKNCGFIEQ